jgi:hypothetical protein
LRGDNVAEAIQSLVFAHKSFWQGWIATPLSRFAMTNPRRLRRRLAMTEASVFGATVVLNLLFWFSQA